MWPISSVGELLVGLNSANRSMLILVLWCRPLSSMSCVGLQALDLVMWIGILVFCIGLRLVSVLVNGIGLVVSVVVQVLRQWVPYLLCFYR